MNEMYWITRLEVINTISKILFIIILLILVAALLFRSIECEKGEKDYVEASKIIKQLTIWIIPFFLIVLFAPSEKDMYKIIGIGGTYDYLKQNETAKELPDKVALALDKLLDEQIKK